MTYRVEVTDEALDRIDAHARYIREAGSPMNAERWLERVLESVESLERWPRRCRLATESGRGGVELRARNIDGFLLIFTVDDERKRVVVITARHGRQRSPEAD